MSERILIIEDLENQHMKLHKRALKK